MPTWQYLHFVKGSHRQYIIDHNYLQMIEIYSGIGDYFSLRISKKNNYKQQLSDNDYTD